MNWETILKKRRFQNVYFKEIKEALLKIVKNMESGAKFETVTLKGKLVEALRKERTDANKDYNRGLTRFNTDKADAWLKMTGSKILHASGLLDTTTNPSSVIKVRL